MENLKVVEKKMLKKPEVKDKANYAMCLLCPGSVISITYATTLMIVNPAAGLAM